MEKIYMTRSISEKLDLRVLIKIKSLLENEKMEEMDYLQIFEVKDNKLTQKQEQPQMIKNYDLKGNFKDTKVWAVRGEDERVGRYWTIMFPEDY